MSRSLFLLVLPAALLVGCGPTFDSCGGAQSDFDSAFASCRAVAQQDVCAGKDKGTNYAAKSQALDICQDHLGDKATDGCEQGYAQGYDKGCETP